MLNCSLFSGRRMSAMLHTNEYAARNGQESRHVAVNTAGLSHFCYFVYSIEARNVQNAALFSYSGPAVSLLRIVKC